MVEERGDADEEDCAADEEEEDTPIVLSANGRECVCSGAMLFKYGCGVVRWGDETTPCLNGNVDESCGSVCDSVGICVCVCIWKLLLLLLMYSF